MVPLALQHLMQHCKQSEYALLTSLGSVQRARNVLYHGW